MSEFKLTYFNTQGLAEPIRYMFALAEVEYEDIRLPKDEHWPRLVPEVKARFPWGVVPVLEHNGTVISQSFAIYRFLARKFGFAGSNNIEAAKIDELLDTLKDWKTGKLDEDRDSQYMRAFEQVLISNGGNFYVGNKLSMADICFAQTFFKLGNRKDTSHLDSYPMLKTHVDKFFEIPQIQEWVKKRPDTI